MKCNLKTLLNKSALKTFCFCLLLLLPQLLSTCLLRMKINNGRKGFTQDHRAIEREPSLTCFTVPSYRTYIPFLSVTSSLSSASNYIFRAEKASWLQKGVARIRLMGWSSLRGLSTRRKMLGIQMCYLKEGLILLAHVGELVKFSLTCRKQAISYLPIPIGRENKFNHLREDKNGI